MSDQGGPPEPPVVVVGGGDGNNQGGGSGGGGGGGGGSSSVDLRRPYRSILLRLGIPVGLFVDLISRAASERWTADEFLWAMSNTKQFNRLFPRIGSLIDSGMGIAAAVTFWKRMASEYELALRNAGLWNDVKGYMNKAGIGEAIAQGMDPEEVLFRASIIEQARRTESLRNAFNAVLKNKQEQQLDKQGWARFLMGKADRKFYDLYEGAVLFQELGAAGLKGREARRLGRAVGFPGQPADLSSALEDIFRIRQTLGDQTLRDAGVTPAELALAALGSQLRDKRRIDKARATKTLLEQLLANQEALEGARDTQPSAFPNDRPISLSAPGPEVTG